MDPRRMRRKLRKATRVRDWPRRTKIAVGAWIPAIVLALALFTGPNRSAGSTDGSATGTTTLTTLALRGALALPTPSTVPPDVAIGQWLEGIHPRHSRGQGGRAAQRRLNLALATRAPKAKVTYPKK